MSILPPMIRNGRPTSMPKCSAGRSTSWKAPNPIGSSPRHRARPGAIGAGIGKRSESWQTVAPTIDVPSADDYAKKIEAAGGTIIVPRMDMPGVGALVTFKDTEGNILSILEPAADSQFADGAGPGG